MKRSKRPEQRRPAKTEREVKDSDRCRSSTKVKGRGRTGGGWAMLARD